MRQIFCVVDPYNLNRWELILVLFCNKSIFRISVSGDDEDAVCQFAEAEQDICVCIT